MRQAKVNDQQKNGTVIIGEGKNFKVCFKPRKFEHKNRWDGKAKMRKEKVMLLDSGAVLEILSRRWTNLNHAGPDNSTSVH